MRPNKMHLLPLAALAVVLAAPGLARAAGNPCLTGASAATGATGAGDVAEIAAARAAVDAACNCAAFDGTPPNLTHAKYAKCAKNVIIPRVSANQLRPQCKGLVTKLYAQSTCGFTTTPHGDKKPCVKKLTSNGKISCAIKPTGRCTDTAGRFTQDPCPDYTYCLDAADTNTDLLLTASDSGTCKPFCGNNATESPEECDGTSDSACPGKCLSNCVCAVCGNGITESPVEECDGASGACPGLCTGSCTCPTIGSQTIDIPSGAEPPNTPGTLGVTVTNPKLITEFGGTSFSLNKARYTRFHWNVPSLTPDAILVLVPGFEGGANDFKILGENLLAKALVTHGLVLEVWGFDRRTNQLEDTAGLDISENLADPLVGIDWLFGGQLGLTLSPALVSGPNRRAVFYNPQSDVPFMANWTNLVFSRDIDAVVAAANAVAPNNNVFLGGHSAGTGFVARYASTDFNLTGVGPADPGYAKVRGLVLLEGGGGSTAGTPLTSDSLDRIEAKFDGGLFGAVRDNAPRCVDGLTACTIATETTDCAAFTNKSCTLPTTTYSISAILNPQILAASEPAAIQTINDPDSGRTILQVDQGAPGNSPVLQVPELAPLLSLAAATAMGGVGGFVDDDGTTANLAPFVATSVGGPGPSVGGLQTWQDITEGPLPGTLTPNNGPAPTTLPGSRWGQEKEVTKLSRLLTTFYAGGSNFTDWYYPVAGPSTTSASGRCSSGFCVAGNVGAPCGIDSQCGQTMNLDSTTLSVGRGRRDIENLTQAPNVNIPVICFGATNGLTTVPGAYTAFAQSIGMCTAASCTGAVRVIDPVTPNPAFPTFGDVAGGFEVHMNEGFAHVDVTTAEDTADNHVLGPLADFIARNVVP